MLKIEKTWSGTVVMFAEGTEMEKPVSLLQLSRNIYLRLVMSSVNMLNKYPQKSTHSLPIYI